MILLYTNSTLSLILQYYKSQTENQPNFLIDVIINLNLNNILTILSIRVYTYSEYEKRIKSTSELTKHINAYIN